MMLLGTSKMGEPMKKMPGRNPEEFHGDPQIPVHPGRSIAEVFPIKAGNDVEEEDEWNKAYGDLSYCPICGCGILALHNPDYYFLHPL